MPPRSREAVAMIAEGNQLPDENEESTERFFDIVMDADGNVEPEMTIEELKEYFAMLKKKRLAGLLPAVDSEKRKDG